MTHTDHQQPGKLEPVRTGFVPLADSAPLIVAARRGFAAAEGIDLQLRSQASWASVRDRINVGHLDVAQMLAGMPIASTLGIGHVTAPMIAPFAFGSGGNAIVLSRRLAPELDATGLDWRQGAMAAAMALTSVAAKRAEAGDPPPVMAMVFPFSSHNYELRYWLAAAGGDPDGMMRLVVIPPPMMVESLRAGQIDGFCAGEPWGSLAVDAGLGSIVAVKQDIWPGAPEKVLGVSEAWALRHGDTLERLLRSLAAASDWCMDPANLDDMTALLAAPEFVGAPQRILKRAFSGCLIIDPAQRRRHEPEFLSFAGSEVNFPSPAGAAWIYSQMARWGQTDFSPADADRASNVYRPDILARALGVESPESDGPRKASIDGIAFDPADLPGYLQQLSAYSA